MNFDKIKSEPIFSISTAAKLLGISVPTLRMYEREGLIISYKTESNQRMYSQLDIERVECIRTAIKKSKFSINGIKAIYSLIPCWEVRGCSKEDREKCTAYNEHDRPCWEYKNPYTVCENTNCRECDVYLKFSKCGDIKNLIKTISGKNDE